MTPLGKSLGERLRDALGGHTMTEVGVATSIGVRAPDVAWCSDAYLAARPEEFAAVVRTGAVCRHRLRHGCIAEAAREGDGLHQRRRVGSLAGLSRHRPARDVRALRAPRNLELLS
jgi:hypothetical protein